MRPLRLNSHLLNKLTGRPAPVQGMMQFEQVRGSWSGNDYSNVSVTRVRDSTGYVVALAFMTHMNIDFDGAPNAYGPPGSDTLDSLDNAGWHSPTGYYGLQAVGPDEQLVVDGKPVFRKDGKPVLKKDFYNLELEHDARLADALGRLPVKQKSGPFKGFYVSATSRHDPNGSQSQFEQSHYLDSSAVAYYATSYGIASQGVGDGDFGVALRLDTFQTASFSCLAGEGHAKGSAKAYALGECSYRVFLDIGGTPKPRNRPYADNNFPTVFLLFPGAKSANLWRLSAAVNSYALARFIAMQALADRQLRGSSGMSAFGPNDLPAGGDSDLAATFIGQDVMKIVAALQHFGYNPQLSVLSAAV